MEEFVKLLKEFSKAYGRRTKTGRYKVGHIPYMRVNPKSIRNKILAKRRNDSGAKRAETFRARPDDQGFYRFGLREAPV